MVRDGFNYCVSQLKQLAAEKYPKLLESCQHQVWDFHQTKSYHILTSSTLLALYFSKLLWLVRELVKISIREVDVVCLILLRQIPSADLSPKVVWLADALLNIFTENK